IRPSKIVLAGDSAGGNLCSTALTVLCDMGMPLPARAILISPWVDLTHNFPSNMHNSKTVSSLVYLNRRPIHILRSRRTSYHYMDF
ncbi:hypothetical protein C8R41DRAFT_765666, partial [Lentinula lateritia]